ncbi:MAG: cysteine hydrolase, partial [Actinobacteria bacterium]|nr:cysteine hydrolase [Actinomycetota bacterium]
PDLEYGGLKVPGASVHAAFVAALGDGYATVATAEDLLTESA